MLTGDHHITVLTKPGCHLCDAAREAVARIATDLHVSWDERDITGDDQLQRQYAEEVPVILVDGRPHGFWQVDEARLRATLAR